MARGTAPHLPRRRARRRQDLRDAQRGQRGGRAAAPTSWSGFVETHGRPNTAGADRRPRGRPRGDRSTYRGTTFEEMDVDAVLARKPDGRAGRRARAHQRARLAGTRSAGRTSRSCSTPGIDVISTVNIQHLESMNDVVEQITGIKQRETIPDEVVRRGRPDRARRHDARGAAPAHGARQHLPAREGRRRRSPTTSARATSARCASSR